jgi:hypothetical protein
MIVSAERRESPHLYLIGEGNGSGVVKIGRSENPRRRLSDVQVNTPLRMQLIHVVEDGGDFERPLHREFADINITGEWFDFGDRDPVGAVLAAIDVIRQRQEEAEARRAADAERWTNPSKPCADFGCSAWSAVNVVGVAARYLLDTHPDPAAWLAEQGIADHCIETAFPGLTRSAEVA